MRIIFFKKRFDVLLGFWIIILDIIIFKLILENTLYKN